MKNNFTDSLDDLIKEAKLFQEALLKFYKVDKMSDIPKDKWAFITKSMHDSKNNESKSMNFKDKIKNAIEDCLIGCIVGIILSIIIVGVIGTIFLAKNYCFPVAFFK